MDGVAVGRWTGHLVTHGVAYSSFSHMQLREALAASTRLKISFNFCFYLIIYLIFLYLINLWPDPKGYILFLLSRNFIVTSAKFQKCGSSHFEAFWVLPVTSVPSYLALTCTPLGWRQTDRHLGIRQKDGPREETCHHANEASAVSDTTLGVRLSKARGTVGGFFSSIGRLYFPHEWKLDTAICHWVPGMQRISLNRKWNVALCLLWAGLRWRASESYPKWDASWEKLSLLDMHYTSPHLVFTFNMYLCTETQYKYPRNKMLLSGPQYSQKDKNQSTGKKNKLFFVIKF